MKRRQRAGGQFVLGFAGFCMVISLQGAASAAASQLELSITSKVCVVDIVQDGSGQTIQSPTIECEVMLPNLLTTAPLNSEGVPALSLPFAGTPTPDQIFVRPISGLAWAPITSTDAVPQTRQPTFRQTATMATAIGTTVAATLVGIDIALFEFRHSLRAAQWIRGRLARP